MAADGERRPLVQHENETSKRDQGSMEHQRHGDGASSDQEQTTPRSAPDDDEPDRKRLVLIIGSMYVGVFMNAIDSTIVATLSAPISDSFNSLQLLSWLATAYLISNAALQPLTGRLTDIFGRRAGLVWSNIFFAAGNLMCGLAKNQQAIIAGRVIAGLGGGGVNSIATFVGSDLVPLRSRGLLQGYINICYGIGAGFGGVFGGFINDSIGWRYAFLVQVPIILLSAVLCFCFVDIPVKETDVARIKRVDFLGAATLVVSLVLLLLGLNSGGNLVPWNHPLVYVSIPLSLVTFAAFIYIEDQVASEPIIPVRLCLSRTIASACLSNWFATMATYAMVFYGPIFFQVIGSSATQAGVHLMPVSLGGALGSVGSGWIMRKTGKYWWLGIWSQAQTVLAAVLITSTMTRSLPQWPVFIYFFLEGLGYGALLTVTLLAVISAVDHEHQAVITSATYAFRSTGSTVGISIASTVFQNLLNRLLWSRFGNWPDAEKIIPRIRDNIDEIQKLPPDWREGVIDVCVEALRGVWVAMLGFSILAALAGLFMREHVLHKKLARE